jgi:hypothetical protein
VCINCQAQPFVYETVSSSKKTLNSKELVSCFDLQLNALLVGENYDVYIAAREMSNFT